MHEKVCAECGLAFKARRIDQRFCAPKCANVYKQRVYRQANGQKCAALRKRWRTANPAKVKAQKRRFKERHPDWEAKRQKKRREANPERQREYLRAWRNDQAAQSAALSIYLKISQLSQGIMNHGNDQPE